MADVNRELAASGTHATVGKLPVRSIVAVYRSE